MIRVLILLLALALPLRAQELPALHAVTGVAADDVLNIRAQPDAAAEIIGTLAPDATGVEVLGTSGTWAMVNTGDGMGYAALRFLAREPGPDWNALQSPLTCLGTEPFWSLEIDPQAGTTRLLTPEDQAAAQVAVTGLWPALPWARSAAVGLPDGIAVLTGGECWDGMSDRGYGISADLFLRSTEGRSRLSGCCRLGLP